MRKFFCFSPIVFSFSLCLGIPGQARAKEGGCDGSVQSHRKPDDVLSAVGAVFHKLAAHQSKPCGTTKVAPAPNNASSIMMTAVVSKKNPAIAKAGLYEITLTLQDVQGLAPGRFPALSLDTQEKTGFWRKRVMTSAIVRKTDDGNFLCTLVFKTPPSAHSAVAIDLGAGNLAQIGGDVMLANGKIAPASPKTKKHFKKKEYAALRMMFHKKPSSSMALVRRTAPIAVPAALGFVVGGPLGAGLGGGVPLIRSFINSKLTHLQAPPTEEASTHVQYVMEGQAEKIATLEAKLAAMQRQLDALRAAALATAGK